MEQTAVAPTSCSSIDGAIHSTESGCEPKKWICQKCGSCCKVAGYIEDRLNRGDGVCKHLDKNNMCEIYETRPDMCRTWHGDDQARNVACNYLRKVAKANAVPVHVP